jgi:CubicO group peptidase (beta-lactamase class C family)
MTTINGWTAPGWERVRDAFQANFDEGSEIGSAFGAYHKGHKVVDLWGGIANPDTGSVWDEDTLIPVFSTSKGVVAICANHLIQHGRIDIDAPVSAYWPEFAQHGKRDIPVSYLLSHQAGLAWTDEPMTAEQAFAWDPVIRALELQAPVWEPGTRHGYHATTYGWLVGEVIRRVTGMSVGAYVRTLAEPLDLELWIGLPESEEARVAPLVTLMPPGDPYGETVKGDPVREVVAAVLGPDTPLGKALFAPGQALRDWAIWNTRAMHAAEMPAVNAITNGRSLARLYGACVSDVDGIRLLSTEQAKAAGTQRTHGPDLVLLDLDIQFGLGFMVHGGDITVGGPGSFGHFGAGGSMGWCDPDAELGMGYVMNRMEVGLTGDTRAFNLTQACYDSMR